MPCPDSFFHFKLEMERRVKSNIKEIPNQLKMSMDIKLKSIFMKYLSLLCFFFVSVSGVYSQFEKIQSFQKNLIENEITASNVALVFKDGKVIYHNIENSMNPNGKPMTK